MLHSSSVNGLTNRNTAIEIETNVSTQAPVISFTLVVSLLDSQ